MIPPVHSTLRSNLPSVRAEQPESFESPAVLSLSPQDELSMLARLRDGTISALVIDKSFADYYTSINCDLFEVGLAVDLSVNN